MALLRYWLTKSVIYKAIQFGEKLQKRSRTLDKETERSELHDLLRQPSPPNDNRMRSSDTSVTRGASSQSSTPSEDGGDIPYSESQPVLSTNSMPKTSSQIAAIKKPDSSSESPRDEIGKEVGGSNYPESTAVRTILKSSDEKSNGLNFLKGHREKEMSWDEIRETYAERFKVWRSADSLKRWHGMAPRDLVSQFFLGLGA